MAKKIKNRNYYRLATQLSVVALLLYMLIRSVSDRNYAPDFEAYCPFGGMQALFNYFNLNTLACSMTTTQIALGVALFVGVVLLSKLFCSFICPLGTLSEWLGKVGNKLKIKFRIHPSVGRFLRVIKYILLFLTIYFTVSSSELFCRQFDPYFATLTGFKGDVNLYYALAALLLLVAGSVLISQFWCKFICPLGAITNLMVYGLPTVAIILLWVLLKYAVSLQISWVWMLGAVCVSGFLFEATTLSYLVFPALRITRDDSICTHCRICDKKCPMNIPVSSVQNVRNIDCHLCTDCISVCPENGALQINKRKNIQWIIPAALIILVGAALLYSSKYELPTISEHWGDINATSVRKIEISGLKNIKCFGSSRAFANQMHEIQGIEGVETYVKHHKVVIYYDTAVITGSKVKEAVFTPLSEIMHYSTPLKTGISFVEMHINNCFDVNDQSYLAEKLYSLSGVLALTTEYGEPVKATVYFDPSLQNVEKIKQTIEQQHFETGSGNQKISFDTDFKVMSPENITGNISNTDFLKKFFEEYQITFNNFDKYSTSELEQFSLPFHQAIDTKMQQWIPYLISHCSNDDGIVGFSTSFSELGVQLSLTYVGKMTSPSKIKDILNSKELLVHYPDKHTEKVDNPFIFK